mmetsp:Transcript_14630/g.22669  ORF Transcript_14630/g.22669 Transcript_14630/m.22669 type:complete len:169 (-) Transcript_14630:4997-5503(-)
MKSKQSTPTFDKGPMLGIRPCIEIRSQKSSSSRQFTSPEIQTWSAYLYQVESAWETVKGWKLAFEKWILSFNSLRRLKASSASFKVLELLAAAFFVHLSCLGRLILYLGLGGSEQWDPAFWLQILHSASGLVLTGLLINQRLPKKKRANTEAYLGKTWKSVGKLLTKN